MPRFGRRSDAEDAYEALAVLRIWVDQQIKDRKEPEKEPEKAPKCFIIMIGA